MEELKAEMYPQLSSKASAAHQSANLRQNSESTNYGQYDGLQPIPEDSEMDEQVRSAQRDHTLQVMLQSLHLFPILGQRRVYFGDGWR